MGFCLGIELDIFIGALIGLKYSSTQHFKGIVNLIASLVVVLFYTIITVCVIEFIYKSSKKAEVKSEDDIEQDIDNKEFEIDEK